MCEAAELTLQDWVDDTLSSFPHIPMAWIQSKYDAVQEAYYSAIAADFRDRPLVLAPSRFYKDASEIFVG